MALLPSSLTLNSNSNVADLFSKPLPTVTHQRTVSLIGAGTTVDPLASADPTATVDSLAAVVDTASDSVPLLHPNPAPAPTLPIVLDTGASFSRTPLASDFCVIQAPYGLIRSPTSVVPTFNSNSSKFASTPGEDVSVDPFDLSSTDTTIVHSNSGPSYLQAFTLFHLIPIWIYYLLHFAVNLE